MTVSDDSGRVGSAGSGLPVESERLRQADELGVPWRRWGPYLSDRQWGTVREDYSDNGDAWSSFSHDQARSRAYRWGEDGIAGFSDDRQLLCLALAVWNGQDPILKERFFGLTNSEGNHGEDVKEYYFYLDATPTHSYQRFLYKYPQAAYPYDDLVHTNRTRDRHHFEYELIDTGVFDDDRYFDITVEYAKASVEDVIMRISVVNRGRQPAQIDVLPTLWFRNTWSDGNGDPRPSIEVRGQATVVASHPLLGDYLMDVGAEAELLFTDNETNTERLWGVPADGRRYLKDGIHDYVVCDRRDAVNPDRRGTKFAARHRLEVGPGDEQTVLVRLRRSDSDVVVGDAGALVDRRLVEADEFYASITPEGLDSDAAEVMRQALAGMLWTKQYYGYDVDLWLREHQAHPLRRPIKNMRNDRWFHMRNGHIISMPDKWEYPWFAAWDLAFHVVALSMVDRQFALNQVELMLSDPYLHPCGQIPAYEWNFGDVNPPVHAWATLFAYSATATGSGDPGDVAFLRNAFKKLLLNFSWWINRKDREGRNVFEGGFLGLDNIGVFDRSAPLPTGGYIEQADGTAWMALFSQNMLELALELAAHDPTYEDFALRFVGHFFSIAAAMDPLGEHPDELWDEEDGFYYDVLRLPDGTASRIKVRSMVGLLPLCAVTVIPAEAIVQFPELAQRVRNYLDRNHDLLGNIADPLAPGVHGRRLLSVLNETKLRKVLTRMLDEDRFLGPHGIRSLSRWHKDHPYRYSIHGQEYRVEYLPAESDTGMFGGNSNWRGPVWFPINLLIIRALLQYYLFYGDEFLIECPTGSGRAMTLFEVAHELADRLCRTFLRDEQGRRPVYGGTTKFQNDPHWRDLILFHEYFHGDNGAGLGASHQTGWTGTVARLIQLFGSTTAADVLNGGTRPMPAPYQRRPQPAARP
jgi:Mannosylglycerate hydrolase MGH1-like glycoside hydrolase domain